MSNTRVYFITFVFSILSDNKSCSSYGTDCFLNFIFWRCELMWFGVIALFGILFSTIASQKSKSFTKKYFNARNEKLGCMSRTCSGPISALHFGCGKCRLCSFTLYSQVDFVVFEGWGTHRNSPNEGKRKEDWRTHFSCHSIRQAFPFKHRNILKNI